MVTSATRKKSLGQELLQDGAIRQKIAERAYFMSEQQGFVPGCEQEHWLAAEAAMLEELMKNSMARGSAEQSMEVETTPAKKPRVRKSAAVVAEANSDATPRKRTRKKNDSAEG